MGLLHDFSLTYGIRTFTMFPQQRGVHWFGITFHICTSVIGFCDVMNNLALLCMIHTKHSQGHNVEGKSTQKQLQNNKGELWINFSGYQIASRVKIPCITKIVTCSIFVKEFWYERLFKVMNYILSNKHMGCPISVTSIYAITWEQVWTSLSGCIPAFFSSCRTIKVYIISFTGMYDRLKRVQIEKAIVIT